MALFHSQTRHHMINDVTLLFTEHFAWEQIVTLESLQADTILYIVFQYTLKMTFVFLEFWYYFGW